MKPDRSSPIHRAAGLAALVAATWAAAPAHAQSASPADASPSLDNVVKLGYTRYTTHSKSSGISGIGVPAGADADVGDASTAILVYERRVLPNIGVELVIGYPPRLHAKATGSVAFLGDDVLSAKIIAPTAFVNYHFGSPGDTWRPYLGAGLNYTRFTSVRSSLARNVELGDSYGFAAQAGLSYAAARNWGLFASIDRIDVKTKVVASDPNVLTTKIDFRPWTFTFGGYFQF